MPLTEEQSKKLEQFKKESKEVRSIILKLIRTEESDGCYNPYNKCFDYIVDSVHDIREILKAKFEDNSNPQVDISIKYVPCVGDVVLYHDIPQNKDVVGIVTGTEKMWYCLKDHVDIDNSMIELTQVKKLIYRMPKKIISTIETEGLTELKNRNA